MGAGIVGLAHAYHLAKRGRKVVLIERNPRAQGASIRNFGMIWPIGQGAGRAHRTALRSREIWLEVLQQSGLWHNHCGSLHLAYREDEAEVLREFASLGDYDGELLDAEGAQKRSQAINPKGLMSAFWSPTELCVDPREVIAGLPGWLQQTYGVALRFGHPLVGYDRPTVTCGAITEQANHLWLCPGDEVTGPFADTLTGLALQRTKLQMMRTVPQTGDWKLGPFLAAGLTLRHYTCFESCKSLQEVVNRVARETPEFDRWGIHVMAAQNGLGELVLGDSHVYGDEIGPFDSPEIDRLIMDYLNTFLIAPTLEIAGRWHGTYAKKSNTTHVVARPDKGVTIIAGLGGAGMTMSFGIAEQVVRETIGEG